MKVESNRNILVGEVALSMAQVVVLNPCDVLRVAVERMSRVGLGIACVVERDMTLAGVFTDGDIRRVLLSEHKPIAALFADDVSDYMTRSPKTIGPEATLEEGVLRMGTLDVLDLPVLDGEGRLRGLLHMPTALNFLLDL